MYFLTNFLHTQSITSMPCMKSVCSACVTASYSHSNDPLRQVIYTGHTFDLCFRPWRNLSHRYSWQINLLQCRTLAGGCLIAFTGQGGRVSLTTDGKCRPLRAHVWHQTPMVKLLEHYKHCAEFCMTQPLESCSLIGRKSSGESVRQYEGRPYLIG